MNTSVNASSQDFSKEADVLKKLLESVPAKSLELPNLKSPSEPAWTHWYQDLVQWLRDLLFSNVDSSGLNQGFKSLANFLAQNWIVLIVIFTLALLIIGVIHIRRKVGQKNLPIHPVAPSQLDRITLSARLTEALREGNFALAARIRWTLFLIEAGAAPSLTPQEYFKHSAKHPLDPRLVQTFYAPMFDPKSNQENLFAALNQSLAEQSKQVRT